VLEGSQTYSSSHRALGSYLSQWIVFVTLGARLLASKASSVELANLCGSPERIVITLII
jgi:hypothetical protein